MKDTVQKALNAIQRDYQNEVNEYAKDFDDRISAGEWDSREDFFDSLHEEIDGAARVIYTMQARLGLLASSNEDAAAEQGVELDYSDGTPYSALMYYAFQADILEAMESDVDDDDTFEPEEDEDDED